VNEDYLDLLRLFGDCKVRYLIIGGYAVIRYAEPRYTKDLDIWIEPSPNNAKRVLKALTMFGAPIDNLSVADLAKPGLLYVFGIPPVRVDILNRVKGETFEAAWASRDKTVLEKVKVYFVDRSTLIKLKKASGRPQDKADLVQLKLKK